MAESSGTMWGPVAGSYGRLGIYTSISSTNTKTTVSVEVWFWSKYSVIDDANTLYFDIRSSSGSATTSRGSTSIHTTVDTGTGWSTTNKKKLWSGTYEYDRGTSNATKYLYAKLTDIDRVGSAMNVNVNVTIPKLTSYTISYNANGGSGAPSSQTKYYGKNLTLSKTKPTRTGYSFQGWATSSGASSASYSAGGTYTANSSITLYAVWKANTYSVMFDANGGSGAPSKQTKTYGVELKLSTVVPTRDKYTFLGWSTSESASTATYQPGGSYTNNANATLYAVWKLGYVRPRIDNYSVDRCDVDGTLNDEGSYAIVSFDWACDEDVSSIVIDWGDGQLTVNATVKSGSVSTIVGNGELGTEVTYLFSATVSDASGYSVVFGTLNGMDFTIDLLAGGRGVALGKPAELEGVFDVAFQTLFRGGIKHPVIENGTDLNTITIPNTYIGNNASSAEYANCPLTSGTFTLEVTGAGPTGQLRQRLTRCYKTDATVYERFYYTNAWGDWVRHETGDSGWKIPTLTSKFSIYGSSADNDIKYRKIGKMVEIRGIITPTADITGGTDIHDMFTVDSGYRPSTSIYVLCQGSSNSVWLLRVTKDGVVGFSRYRNGNTSATATAGTWLPFQVTYFVD
jgi:uncharacterized repeat protein (TIGR02543 family)